jgi:hypothetical protein
MNNENFSGLIGIQFIHKFLDKMMNCFKIKIFKKNFNENFIMIFIFKTKHNSSKTRKRHKLYAKI